MNQAHVSRVDENRLIRSRTRRNRFAPLFFGLLIAGIPQSAVSQSLPATFLDLKESANMGFADDVADDGKGGWSDQGSENDLRSFDPTQADFGGVPFRILKPEENQGRAVMTFRGAHLAVPLTEARVAIHPPTKARYLYLLHTTCFNEKTGRVGTVMVHTGDGALRTLEIESGRDVADWWGAGAVSNGAVVYRQSNRSSTVGLYLSRFDLGEETVVREVEFRTAGHAIWIVVGATLTVADIPLPEAGVWKAVAGKGWKPIDLSEVRIAEGSALDFSSLVEAGPAGQWGRVKVLPGGDLAFENKPEKKVRFFAFQLLVNHLFEARGSALAADTEEETRARIRDWVKAVRRQGYNMVRLQAVDLYLMAGTTQDLEFNPVHWDRFEYLVHRLKEEGIYIGVDAMSFLGYRSVRWFEGMAQRYRLRMMVDDEARLNWKHGVAAMMTHVNPYTSLSLARDPMVVFVTCFNEQDLELYWDPVFSMPEIRPFAEQKWKTFLAEKYSGRPEDLAKVWGSTDAASVPIYTRDHLSAGGDRAGDIARFLFKLQDDVTAWYLDLLKEFGYDGLAVQYDVISQYIHHVVHARTLAVANHGYHGHPSDKSNPGSRVQQDGAIQGAAQYFRSRAVARFNDRPFFITEYGIPYWHRYRHEEGILFPALAALQGVQAIAVHAQAVILEHRLHMEDFSVGRDPINRANQTLAALFYGRGDVASSKHRVEIVFDDAWVFRGNNAFKSVDSGLSRIALVSGVGLRYDGPPAPPGIPPAPKADLSLQTSSGGEVVATEWTAGTVDTAKSDTAARAIAAMRRHGILSPTNRTDSTRGIYESDTAEILMETEIERMSVITPRSCGVVIKPGVEGSAGAIVSARSDVAASVGVGALDDLPLSDSRRILVVYATDAVNSGHETSEDRVVLRKLGTLPILVETGTLSLRIRNQNAASLRGYALGMDGTRREEVTLTAEEGVLSLIVDTATLTVGPALFFELVQPVPEPDKGMNP